MRIIELFDTERPINNVMVQATYPQAQVVFAGVDGRPSEEERARLKRYFRESGSPAPEFVDLGTPDSGAELAGRLEPLACGDDTYVEASGGSDELLVALGAVAALRPISVFRIDPDGAAVPEALYGQVPPLRARRHAPTFERVIGLLGGCIVDGSTEDRRIPVDADMRRAVAAVWREYQRDPSGYNGWGSTISRLCNSHDESTRTHDVEMEPTLLAQLGAKNFARLRLYLDQLERAGLIAVARAERNRVAFDYKSRALHRIIDKPGEVLEYFVRICATDTGIFDEVRQGVYLDWDGDLTNRGAGVGRGTTNEVDLVLTRGFRHFYVSCKSGKVGNEALYEIATVAEKFDTGNVTKILVCGDCTDAIVERAGDMGIYLFAKAYEETTGKNLQQMLALV